MLEGWCWCCMYTHMLNLGRLVVDSVKAWCRHLGWNCVHAERPIPGEQLGQNWGSCFPSLNHAMKIAHDPCWTPVVPKWCWVYIIRSLSSLYIIICHYISLYIIIYHYISLYIIIYHYISLYIMIYHYRVGIFQPKDASWCIYQIYHWYSQWKLLRPIRGSKVSSCSTPSPGVPLGDPCVSAGCLRLPDVPRCPKMSQDVPRCPKMSKVLILRAQTIVTIAVGRWPVAVWVTFSCELMLAHGTHGGWTSF